MIYNKLIESIILPIGDFFLKTTYIKRLKYWRSIDSLSLKDINKVQKKSLQRVLELANKKLKLYEQIKFEGDDPYIWLKEFPILTKKKLNENIDNLLTEDKKGLHKFSTSGSSGIRAEIYMNNEDLSSFRAGNTRWWEWGGYKIGDNLLQTGMTPNRKALKGIKDVLFKTLYVSAFALSEEQMYKILNKVKDKNYYLLGYASSLNILAEFAIDKGIPIEFNSVISLGDKLFSHYKKNIKKAFNSNIIETYGSSEGFLIACQYDLDYLYINSAQVYLELLDENNRPVEDGEIGYVVVTRLDNSAMPLIRYKIGDLAIKLPKEEYPTSRKLDYPLLKKVIGRDTDVVILPDNRKLIVHSFTGIFEYFEEIKQFKVIQYNNLGITIEYVKGKNYQTEVLDKILKKLQAIILDFNFKIYFKEVLEIKATKSGKPQIVESHIKSLKNE
ncbi:phenylacetate--CoA ligase family protein [Polaribacter atrinae]|uniref:Uncharacterized protein n=1 Tax=Polaribacter atrinae TaxID=1333662 RepID=A0A176TEQ4_9FLAO|nr:phenylacetate--CoA ligase family protein [Polaribacter atrinae]OAD46121.1 hypothetical protein LPB303_04190 [Polaribacter atrinae]